MATRPNFPQPATFYDRVRLAADVIRGRYAQPLDTNPVNDASPSEPGAAVPMRAYTRAYGGFSIDPRWLGQLALNSDSLLREEGANDVATWDRLLDDEEAAAAFQQRRQAIIARPWEVEAADESAPAQAAADHIREQLKRLPWDRICDRMLYGLWYGYAVGEAFYEVGPDGKYWLTDILVPDRKWFAFTNAGELRLRTTEHPEGEILPPNKFWSYRTGASHDFAPYGVGLAHWCYWPIWFKKNAIKFWAVYLEKFGMPTALGKFPQGADSPVIDNLLAAASAVGRDSAVVVPQDNELELMAAGRASNDSYDTFVNQMDDYLRRVILGQTGTSKSEAQGLGGSQSNVMKDVRDELVRADSDLLHETFNGTIVKWLTEWNFGPDVPKPRLYRNLEDQEDLDSIVERDVKLKDLGWVRTEESAKEVYGEGYERAAEPEPLPLPGAGGNVIDMAQARQRIPQAAFAADDLDRIDQWADELAKEADPAIAAFVAELKPKVRGIKDADALRVVLLEALEQFPAERLGELAGLPFTAARALAQAGMD